MTLYEQLLAKADKLGIKVKEIDFGIDEECGYYHNNKILINSKLSERKKYCILCEELGHCYTSFGDITNQSILKNKKQELIARRWGYEHSVSIIGLIEAFEYGCRSIYEIADFLGVTEKYLNDCISDYRRKYGVSYVIEQYCIIFEPTLTIGKSSCY